MKHKRRLADVGKYIDPPVRPLAPIEQVVHDGVLVTVAGARLATKNHIIVAALRDHEDFDVDELASFARAAVLSLAEENADTAVRVERETDPEDRRENTNPPQKQSRSAQAKAVNREAHRRRADVHHQLAGALQDFADDPERIADLVERARIDAAEEISRELARGLIAQRYEPDPDYRAERADRVKRLIDLDLLPALEN